MHLPLRPKRQISYPDSRRDPFDIFLREVERESPLRGLTDFQPVESGCTRRRVKPIYKRKRQISSRLVSLVWEEDAKPDSLNG